ncbi:Transcription factor MUTE [Apostasia shenzhenica]|uniref:Transcription factor MUTE n=1 Tax=Apostasia shenzhenica TaxID=1088818 RepID=A0A2I0A031_9ASPA|nr:Transcription factor MUTE [Apostasia shenzhenica]
MHHISVERNRRKKMNEHLRALRSLMPCFYVKRGDQASIIGGAIEYIKELQLLLHSLEAKKQRKGVTGLGACCNSSVADVEAKIMGSNVILRVLSKRAPGQVVKVITVLERHAFEILHLSISSMEDTVLYSYYMKVLI